MRLKQTPIWWQAFMWDTTRHTDLRVMLSRPISGWSDYLASQSLGLWLCSLVCKIRKDRWLFSPVMHSDDCPCTDHQSPVSTEMTYSLLPQPFGNHLMDLKIILTDLLWLYKCRVTFLFDTLVLGQQCWPTSASYLSNTVCCIWKKISSLSCSIKYACLLWNLHIHGLS